jgi:uncharacterized protein YheU (UPF0270 family)
MFLIRLAEKVFSASDARRQGEVVLIYYELKATKQMM